MERNLFRKAIIVIIICFFIGINILPGIEGIKRTDISTKNDFDIDHSNNNNEINGCLLRTMDNDDFSTKKTKEIPYEIRGDTLLEEGFEAGWGDWYADNGVWEVGIPTAGPDGAHSGESCAGTVLDGNYTASTDSRLVCPTLNLPLLNSGEEIVFRFWHWYSYAASDYGYVEVSVYNESSKIWGGWQQVSEKITDDTPVWSVGQVDLSSFAGKRVHVAFAHYADPWPWGEVSYGWYVDDVSVAVLVPVFQSPEDFESGWDGWYTDGGVWEVGIPTAGPDGAHSGESCAGTVLDGNYTASTDSRLVCPTLNLPLLNSGEEIVFRFWHWYSYAASDYGYVEVSVYNESSKIWGGWQQVSEKITDDTPVWSVGQVDLSSFAGKRVHVAFAHYADPWPWGEVSYGWYVDDVEIRGVNLYPIQLSNEYPTDGDVTIERPPINISVNVLGLNLNIYFRWLNHTSITPDWEEFARWSLQSNGRFEFYPQNLPHMQWIWGDTTYTWSVNVTDGTSWTNETYHFTTSGSRYDINNNDIVNFQDAGLVWVHRTSLVSYDGLYDVNQNGQVNFQDAGLTWVNRD